MATISKLFEFDPRNSGNVLGAVSVVDAQGKLFVAYRNDNIGTSFQLDRFNKSTLAFESQTFVSPVQNCKIEFLSGNLYAAQEVDNGPDQFTRITRFNDPANDLGDFDDLQELNGTRLRFFGVASDGNLYVITQEIVTPSVIDSHLYRLDGSSFTLLNTFSDARCETLFINDSDIIAVGYEDGLFKFDPANPAWIDVSLPGRRFESFENGPSQYIFGINTDGNNTNPDLQETGLVQFYDDQYSSASILTSDIQYLGDSIDGVELFKFVNNLYLFSLGNISGGINDLSPKIYNYQAGTSNISLFFEFPENELLDRYNNLNSQTINYIGVYNTVDNKVSVYILYDEFEASATVTDVTVQGGSDGEINISITGGSGDFGFLWADGPTTQNRTGLTADDYQVTITDNVTGEVEVLNITVNEPSVNPEPPTAPYFEVPKIQSFQFHFNKEFSQSPFFNYLDKMSHKDFYVPTFHNGFCYDQKVIQTNIIPVQIRSATPNITIQLIDINGDIVNQYDATETVSLVNQEVSYDIRIENNGSGQSRVYFNGFNTIPIPLTYGESIEITNNSDGFNGVYSIVSIDTDIVGAQYLVINANYGIGSVSSPGTGIFLVNELEFNVYEANIDFNVISLGRYYLKAFVNNFEEDTVHFSEPIKVESQNPKLNLIEFTNIDNAYDIDYTNGITHKLFVESVFFKRIPSHESVTIRNTDGSLSLLSNKARRGILLELYSLPPYLLEKISVALRHDILKINGVEFETKEDLEEPEYLDKYGLADSRVRVEQKEWFRTYNGTDLGGVDGQQGGFIITQKGFIKR